MRASGSYYRLNQSFSSSVKVLLVASLEVLVIASLRSLLTLFSIDGREVLGLLQDLHLERGCSFFIQLVAEEVAKAVVDLLAVETLKDRSKLVQTVAR